MSMAKFSQLELQVELTSKLAVAQASHSAGDKGRGLSTSCMIYEREYVSRANHEVRLLRVAEDDINDIVTYIAADNPDAALKLVDQFSKNLSSLLSARIRAVPPQKAVLHYWATAIW